MPILRLSDEVSDVLQKLVIERKGVSELLDLSAQLSTPLLPPIEDSQYPPGTIVDHRSLVKASQWAALHDDTASRDELRLSRLLRGAEIAMPMLPKPERSAELEEILRKIKLVHEQAEYDAMTASSSSRQQNSKNIPFGFRNSSVKNVNVWQSSAERSEKEEWEEVRRQLGAIFNVALSVGAVAVATWWAAGNADPIWKTLVALPLSLLVAVAEVVLYTRHWSNVQKRKVSRR